MSYTDMYITPHITTRNFELDELTLYFYLLFILSGIIFMLCESENNIIIIH